MQRFCVQFNAITIEIEEIFTTFEPQKLVCGPLTKVWLQLSNNFEIHKYQNMSPPVAHIGCTCLLRVKSFITALLARHTYTRIAFGRTGISYSLYTLTMHLPSLYQYDTSTSFLTSERFTNSLWVVRLTKSQQQFNKRDSCTDLTIRGLLGVPLSTVLQSKISSKAWIADG